MLIDWKLEGRDDARLYLAFRHGAAYNLLGTILIAGNATGPGYSASFETAIHFQTLHSFAQSLRLCLHEPATASLEIYDIGVLDNNLAFEGWESTRLEVASGGAHETASGTVVIPTTSELHAARLNFRFALREGAIKDSIYDFEAVLASFTEPSGHE